MTPTLTFIIQSLVSIGLLYFTVNATFRYQPSMRRELFFVFACWIAIGYLLIDETLAWVLIPTLVVFLASVAWFVWSLKHKRHGLFLFYVFRHQEAFYAQITHVLQHDFHIKPDQIRYCQKKPFLLVLDGIDLKTYVKIQKQVDKLSLSHLVVSFWAKYLPIIFVLILLAAYWRY